MFGFLAWVFVWLYLNTKEDELLQLSDMRPVVVAATDILPGTAIEENMIAEGVDLIFTMVSTTYRHTIAGM